MTTTEEEAVTQTADPPETAEVTEEQEPQPGTAVATRPYGGSIPERISYARALAASGLLPAAYRQNPANVLYAIEYGEMLGLKPMAAITGVHVIEGKPTASAGLISALVRRAGHKLRITGNALTATCQIVRADDPDYVFEVTWTLRKNSAGHPSAEEAGLTGKTVWKNYPASMLKSRAITQCARDACEEALFGLHYTAEELGADVDEEGIVVSAPADVPADPWGTAQPARSGADAWLDWAIDRAAAWTTYGDRDALREKVAAKLRDGKITAEQAGLVESTIEVREVALFPSQANAGEPIDAELVDPGAPAPLGEGDPWADKIADLTTQAECDAAEAEIFELVKHNRMAEAHGDLITEHIRWKAAELARTGGRAAA